MATAIEFDESRAQEIARTKMPLGYRHVFMVQIIEPFPGDVLIVSAAWLAFGKSEEVVRAGLIWHRHGGTIRRVAANAKTFDAQLLEDCHQWQVGGTEEMIFVRVRQRRLWCPPVYDRPRF